MIKNSYKTRYAIFIVTVIVIIIANDAILRYNLGLQNSDAEIINVAGRQRMLSQRISKHLLFLDNGRYHSEKYTLDSLDHLVQEFESSHVFLKSVELQEKNNRKIDSLLKLSDPLLTGIVDSSKKIIRSPDSSALKEAITSVAQMEMYFLNTMEQVVAEYQKVAEKNLSRTKRIAFILSLVSIVVLLGEFIFIIIPFFNDLFRKNKSLELANRKLSDFAHITSHNLRAPVSNLNSLLYFYQESEDMDEKQDLMNKFATVIGNLNETMNTLIASLQAQFGATDNLETLSFQEVLVKTKETISGQLIESEAKIEADFSTVPTVLYNRLYLESIFLNLLTNTIKYKSEVRTPLVTIKSSRQNGKIRLSVQDNGLGINMERHGDKLFGLNKTFHRHPEAKGIGLFMTRTQIEAMGGEISAESKENVGTTFTITF